MGYWIYQTQTTVLYVMRNEKEDYNGSRTS